MNIVEPLFVIYLFSHGCPCGFYTDPKHECTCTPNQIQKYRAKLSGPLLDRIDLQIEVPGISFCQMSSEDKKGESSKILKVARTIADLEDSSSIETPHISEAIQYRSLDRRLEV